MSCAHFVKRKIDVSINIGCTHKFIVVIYTFLDMCFSPFLCFDEVAFVNQINVTW